MNYFVCDICGAFILDSPRGYLTGCKHWPLDLDFFTCRGYRNPIRMTKRACLARQKSIKRYLIKKAFAGFALRAMPEEERLSKMVCWNCNQGKTNRREHEERERQWMVPLSLADSGTSRYLAVSGGIMRQGPDGNAAVPRNGA